jgi:DNA-directed RNA polymerase subunit RPC12/RpoP
VATRTITIHDVCTTDGCGRTLHSISEGERGRCGSCWFKSLSAEDRKSMNRLIASAFNGSSNAEKEAAVDDAVKRFVKRGT